MFLEREPLVATLRELRPGAMVFVAGEAGIGKTSLVREFCATLPTGTSVRYGFCDALGTPRALGPLHDLTRTRPELTELLTAVAARQVVTKRGPPQPAPPSAFLASAPSPRSGDDATRCGVSAG